MVNDETKNDIKIILEEHNLLRNEIMERMRKQTNLLTLTASMLSVLVGYLGIYLKDIDPGENIIVTLFSDPQIMIIVIIAIIIFNSLAALFVFNEKSKTLTVEYIYDFLEPKLNKLTGKIDPNEKHFQWRNFRGRYRSSMPSFITNSFLILGNYTLSLFPSFLLLGGIYYYICTEGIQVSIWPIDSFSWAVILCSLYSVFVLINAVKSDVDKRRAGKPRYDN